MASKQAAVGDFVFWKYDSGFSPHTYLGGVVTKVMESGRVRVQGYDTMEFKPVLVTNPERGAALLDGIKNAERRRDQSVREANASFEAARDSIIQK